MTAIQEYSQTEAGLQELRGRMAGVVYDVRTTKGLDTAKKDRRECVTLRTSLEAMRKEIKAPALERCKLIDTEAKRITEEILKLERPIDEVIKSEEARKEAEKAEKARIEKERVDSIRAKIITIKEYPIKAISLGAAKLAEVLPGVEAISVTEVEYQEFTGEAQFALMESVNKLKQILDDKKAAEAEAARIRAEQEAEAARLKAEKEEAKRKAAEERAALEAERAKLEAERKEQERIRAEDEKKIREAREAEEAKLKAERAELERQQRELAEAKLKAETEELLRREAEAKRITEEKARAERMVVCPKCGHEFDREESAAKEAA
jgi:colicin import membrane protein